VPRGLRLGVQDHSLAYFRAESQNLRAEKRVKVLQKPPPTLTRGGGRLSLRFQTVRFSKGKSPARDLEKKKKEERQRRSSGGSQGRPLRKPIEYGRAIVLGPPKPWASSVGPRVTLPNRSRRKGSCGGLAPLANGKKNSGTKTRSSFDPERWRKGKGGIPLNALVFGQPTTLKGGPESERVLVLQAKD